MELSTQREATRMTLTTGIEQVTDAYLPLFVERIRAGSAMFIRRKLALQVIPIRRRGGSRKIFV
jgi:hypothetical protein